MAPAASERRNELLGYASSIVDGKHGFQRYRELPNVATALVGLAPEQTLLLGYRSHRWAIRRTVQWVRSDALGPGFVNLRAIDLAAGNSQTLTDLRADDELSQKIG
ncbi:hypothetical protein VSH64_40630 [Amycolatopsis rhabdoformis]|uniref:Uncharacterized protein n=1 Tax=Amycolatopsis rhabdoformis TaxID=1448059 RepID=A0ABZ1IQA9_9PSEU|nr:hypothetical protein [Amycolatopsis rhabdoformis]WSE35434.1 hypothetical protein VSH64_40630 [Amycolatopsis rhabdoformis]